MEEQVGPSTGLEAAITNLSQVYAMPANHSVGANTRVANLGPWARYLRALHAQAPELMEGSQAGALPVTLRTAPQVALLAQAALASGNLGMAAKLAAGLQHFSEKAKQEVLGMATECFHLRVRYAAAEDVQTRTSAVAQLAGLQPALVAIAEKCLGASALAASACLALSGWLREVTSPELSDVLADQLTQLAIQPKHLTSRAADASFVSSTNTDIPMPILQSQNSSASNAEFSLPDQADNVSSSDDSFVQQAALRPESALGPSIQQRLLLTATRLAVSCPPLAAQAWQAYGNWLFQQEVHVDGTGIECSIPNLSEGAPKGHGDESADVRIGPAAIIAAYACSLQAIGKPANYIYMFLQIGSPTYRMS